MIDLNKIVEESMKKIESEKYVEGVMEKAIKKTIDSTIDDMFGWDGKLKKQLEKALTDKLNLNLDRIDIETYNRTMANIVSKKLDEVIRVNGVEKLESEMDELLKACKDSYNLSQIVDKLKEEVHDDCDEDSNDLEGSEISLHIDASNTLTFVYFDPEECKEDYECSYRLVINSKTNKLQSAEINDKDFKDKIVMGTPRGIEGLLFKIYSGGAKVILDKGTEPEDYDIEFDE